MLIRDFLLLYWNTFCQHLEHLEDFYPIGFFFVKVKVLRIWLQRVHRIYRLVMCRVAKSRVRFGFEFLFFFRVRFSSNLAFFFRVRVGSGFICRVSGFHKFIFLSKNNPFFGLKNRWKFFFSSKSTIFFSKLGCFYKKKSFKNFLNHLKMNK